MNYDNASLLCDLFYKYILISPMNLEFGYHKLCCMRSDPEDVKEVKLSRFSICAM